MNDAGEASGPYQMAAALETDKLIRSGADQVLIQLIAVFVAGDFADDESVSQAIQEYRQRLLGHENHRVIIRRLDLGDFFEVGRLQAAAFFIAHLLDRERHILRGQRCALQPCGTSIEIGMARLRSFRFNGFTAQSPAAAQC